MATAKAIEIPESLAHLDRDRRGYPIPVTVARGTDGTPYFTINDPDARAKMIEEDRCHVSGHKLLRGRWFIGGPAPAFHPHGAFLDGPMSDAASLYAVQVCPFIAAPNYFKRIDDKLLQKSGDSDLVAVRFHEELTSDRPPLFVRLMTVGQKLVPSSDGGVLFVPKRPYRAVEFWRHGTLLDFQEGLKLAVETSKGELQEDDILAACGLKKQRRSPQQP